MSTPFGHTLVGLALAERLGIHAQRKLALCAALANAPDLDIVLGVALFGEPWRLHRGAMHNIGVVAAVGATLGWYGLPDRSRRDSRLRMAVVGAAIASSHVLLDRLPFVPMSRRRWVPRVLKRRCAGLSLANWLLDIAVGSIIARALHPNRRPSLAVQAW